MADPEVNRFLGGPQPRAHRLAQLHDHGRLLEHRRVRHVLGDRTRQRALGGRLGPWQPEGWPGHEIGWGLLRETWGKGYATEGAAASMDWAFANLGWSQVIHSINPQNLASIGVAKKLGSTWQGPGALPPPFEDDIVDLWGQTREQWIARRR